MHKLNYFFRFRDLEDSDENELTRALLAILRLVPATHFAFLDLIRERQRPGSVPSLVPSILLGLEPDIRTQEGIIHRESGYLISIVLTRVPWQTSLPVIRTEEIRCYDGVLYYGEDWIFILENKPKDDPPPAQTLEHQMCPNLPEGSEI